MAKRTAKRSKRSTSKADSLQPRLKDKTFYLSGDSFTLSFTDCWPHLDRSDAEAMIRLEGGRVAKSFSAKVDYLVPTDEDADLVAQAKKLNKAKEASIALLNSKSFGALFAPTQEIGIAMLKAGAKGVGRWNALVKCKWPRLLDLSGTDFRKCDLNGANLEKAVVDDCDFRGASIEGLIILRVKRTKFDGAVGRLEIATATDCSFKGCRLGEVSAGDYELWKLRNCDLERVDIAGVSNTATAHNCNFDKANCQEAELWGSKFSKCSFRSADLSGATLSECNFTSSNLTGANLSGADLQDAKLCRANLSKADLRGANLMNADLSGATIDGANFEGAGVAGADFSKVDVSRGKGLQANVADVRVANIGPRIQALESNAAKAHSMETQINIETADGPITLGIQVSDLSFVDSRCDPTSAEYHDWRRSNSSVSQTMAELVKHMAECRLLPQTVTAKGEKSPLKGKALKQLCLEAWCELFDEPVPTERELKQLAKPGKQAQVKLSDELYDELKAGKAGVAKWNKRSQEQRDEAGASRKLDLSGLDLRDLQGDRIDFQRSDFTGAKLKGASFVVAILKNTKFDQAQAAGVSFHAATFTDASCQQADFSKCNLRETTLLRTNFSKANLEGADLRQSRLKGADFTGANLAGADLWYTDLKGADFTGAKLSGARFEHTKFDEQTVFPKRFKLAEGLVWAGKGKDPRVREKIAQVQTAGPIDFAAFMQQLEEECDASRLKKALKMLKADRFQLFAQVAGDSVTGVVKSQTDSKLVYACRLDAEGTFACCTQNLNTCGGLRGALCKHLLVLIVGLTKEAELDPTTVNTWVAASGLQSPELDKDLMSEVFLKYKGAEAGEIDWRPTETVPEDYYAF